MGPEVSFWGSKTVILGSQMRYFGVIYTESPTFTGQKWGQKWVQNEARDDQEPQNDPPGGGVVTKTAIAGLLGGKFDPKNGHFGGPPRKGQNFMILGSQMRSKMSDFEWFWAKIEVLGVIFESFWVPDLYILYIHTIYTYFSEGLIATLWDVAVGLLY